MDEFCRTSMAVPSSSRPPASDTSVSAPAPANVASESQPSGSGEAATSVTTLAVRLDERFDVLASRLALLPALEKRIAAAEARIAVLENDNRVLSADNTALRLAQQKQQADFTALNAIATRVAELDERCRVVCSDVAALEQAQLDQRATQFEAGQITSPPNPIELIISGVPCPSPESIPRTVNQVTASLGTDLEDGDILGSRFLITRDKAQKDTPLPIVVKLRGRAVLARLIAAKKAKGRLLTTDLVPCPPGPVTTINLNEALPPDTYRLLIATKTAAKAAGARFVWHHDGTIFVRKAQGSPVKRILSPADLTRLTSE